MSNEQLQNKLNIVIKYFNEKKFKEAKLICRELLLPECPNDVVMYVMGKICDSLNQKDEALHYYDNAIKINPKIEYYKDLGHFLFLNNDYENALLNYSEVLKVEFDPLVGYRAGRIFLHLNNIDLALQCFTHVLNVNPKHAEATFYYAEALLLKGETNIQEIINTYNNAITYDPTLCEAYHRLAEILFAKGEREIAKNILKTAIIINFSDIKSKELYKKFDF